MRKAIVILLIIAAALTVIGGAIFTLSVLAMQNSNIQFAEIKYQTRTYESKDTPHSIYISANTEDIELIPYDDEGYKVVCFEEKKLAHTVTLNEGILRIEQTDSRKWYDHISFYSLDTKIAVYIPKGDYTSLSAILSTGDTSISKDFSFESADILSSTGDIEFYASTKNALNIKTSTGDIEIKGSKHGDIKIETSSGEVEADNIECNDIEIGVSTGDTEISGIRCKSLFSSGGTGDITMESLTASDSISITRGTGNVLFDLCDAAELTINTNTGDVKGSLLSDKIFLAGSKTGKVSLPETTSGGICRINTDTGDIVITVK